MDYFPLDIVRHIYDYDLTYKGDAWKRVQKELETQMQKMAIILFHKLTSTKYCIHFQTSNMFQCTFDEEEFIVFYKWNYDYVQFKKIYSSKSTISNSTTPNLTTSITRYRYYFGQWSLRFLYHLNFSRHERK